MDETLSAAEQPVAIRSGDTQSRVPDSRSCLELTPNSAPKADSRSLLIDVVRGLAISLVVLGHTNQGIAHRGWWGASTVGRYLQSFIYAFHMPAFFFVSGIFLRKSVDKRGPLHFTLTKIRTILYPYLLWTCIYLLASLLFSRFMIQATPSIHTFLFNLITGEGGWFLPSLFFCLMLGMLGRRLPRSLFFLLAVAELLWLPTTSISFIDRGMHELPLLTLGMWVGETYTQFERLSRSPAMLTSVALCAALLLLTTQVDAGASYLIVLFGVLGTLLLLLIARVLGHSAIARRLSWIGQASFGIFLMAPFPQGAGRAMLEGLHITGPYPQLILPTILAVLFPAWLYQHRVRLRLTWLFVPPW